MMVGYDIYDRFTMGHFPLCQNMILTTSFFLLATVQKNEPIIYIGIARFCRSVRCIPCEH
jgi:hypothetical protein